MDEKYKRALEYIQFLDTCVGYHDERTKLPMYMGRYKTTGYKVRYPKLKSRWFFSKNEAADKIAAYAYLRSICPVDKLKRVFKGCDIVIDTEPIITLSYAPVSPAIIVLDAAENLLISNWLSEL